MKNLALLLSLSLVSFPSLARAQDPAAIHAPVPDAVPAPPPPVPVAPPPAIEPPKPGAIAEYNAQSLDIHPAWSFGPYAPVRVGVRWGASGPRSAWHVGVGVPVVPPPLNPSQPWAVFQQQKRLTVPEYLGVVGDSVRANSLAGDIRRANTWSNVWLGVAGAGAVTAVVGLVEAARAETARDRYQYNNAMGVATLGGFAIVGGVLGRSLTSAHAYELENDYKETLTYPETQQAVDAYNQRLREQLGLGPADVGRPSRPR